MSSYLFMPWSTMSNHRHSGVIDLDKGRQVSLNSITDDHFVRGTSLDRG